MLTVIAPPPPPPAIRSPAPLPKVDGENLASLAAQLRQEVAAASTHNAAAAMRSIQQVREVANYEQRARDTLRQLMERMGQDHGERS